MRKGDCKVGKTGPCGVRYGRWTDGGIGGFLYRPVGAQIGSRGCARRGREEMDCLGGVEKGEEKEGK